MAKPRKANHYDKHVAARIRERRKQIGVTQTELGKALDMTFQMIGKIESGTSRISAGNLWKASVALSKPVSFFYEGIGR
jgi:hypothetical protein